MIKKLLNEYRRRKHGFPKKVRRHWLAGDYWKREGNEEGEPRTVLPYHNEEGTYITYKLGDKVTLFREDGYEAVYEITKVRGGGIADTLPWDDNKKYDFKFLEVEKE